MPRAWGTKDCKCRPAVGLPHQAESDRPDRIVHTLGQGHGQAKTEKDRQQTRRGGATLLCRGAPVRK